MDAATATPWDNFMQSLCFSGGRQTVSHYNCHVTCQQGLKEVDVATATHWNIFIQSQLFSGGGHTTRLSKSRTACRLQSGPYLLSHVMTPSWSSNWRHMWKGEVGTWCEVCASGSVTILEREIRNRDGNGIPLTVMKLDIPKIS